MRLTVKELIARAYEVARVLKDADAALLREVATRLDVTYVALSEAMERNQHVATLTAENAELKSFILKECFVGLIEPETFYQEEVTRYVSADGYEPQTPVTDRFIAEQQPLAQVPEEKCDEDGITTSEFDQGWNACRAAMLSNEPVSQSYKLVGEVVAWNSPQRQGVYRSVDFRWLDLNVQPGTRLYARHADFVSEVDQDPPAK